MVFKHVQLLIFSGTCNKGARVTSTSKFRHIVLEKLEQILTKHGLQTTSSPTILTASNKYRPVCVISAFRREVPENCALLCYYAVSIGNILCAFRDNLSDS